MRTSRESIRDNARQQLVKNLEDLLGKNYDAEKGYKTALTHAKTRSLKDFLKQQAFLHARFATELNGHLLSINARPREQHNLMAGLHRAWIDFGTALGSSDNFILDECLRGERAAIREYEQKLESFQFTAVIRFLLSGHLQAMQDNIGQIDKIQDLP